MFNPLYLILPCLALALIVVILEMCSPALAKSRQKEIERAKKRWSKIFLKLTRPKHMC